ncbi:MAG TPA: hypothetical protein VID04_17860 [Methylomirabilota bacterium]
MIERRALFLAGGMALVWGLLDPIEPPRAAEVASNPAASEVLRVLGEGVIGPAQSTRALGDPAAFARWEPGEWNYRITAGPRQGKTEREILAPITVTSRGETWERTIGQEYTLYLRRTPDGGLLMASELAHAYNVFVLFEPPLSYLIPGLQAGERRVFDGRMEIHSSRRQGAKLYSGRIQATTVFAGVYRVTTPAGTFNAALIRTDYQIDVLALVSVKDTLYTFYAEGVGKVAEVEHRQILAAVFGTDTKTGKVLVSFRPASPPTRIEAP